VRTTKKKQPYSLKEMADQSKSTTTFVVGVPKFKNNDDGEKQKTTHPKMPPSTLIPLPGRNRYSSYYNYNRNTSWRQMFNQLGQNQGNSNGVEKSTLKT
jgi:uncharacterized short protein YbdD (DUF466 family)